jgi:hypothetical protein
MIITQGLDQGTPYKKHADTLKCVKLEMCLTALPVAEKAC